MSTFSVQIFQRNTVAVDLQIVINMGIFKKNVCRCMLLGAVLVVKSDGSRKEGPAP